MSSSTARQRAHRAREAAGRIVLRVEVDEAALCVALVDAEMIRPEDQDDRAKLEAAVARLLELMLMTDVADVVSRVTSPISRR